MSDYERALRKAQEDSNYERAMREAREDKVTGIGTIVVILAVLALIYIFG